MPAFFFSDSFAAFLWAGISAGIYAQVCFYVLLLPEGSPTVWR